jgi:UDP-N-acetylmuramate--alanine ligase
VADVYAAGEQPIPGASRDDLVSGLKTRGHKSVVALESPAQLASLVAGVARPGDYVICLGAGNITQWAYALPGELEKLAKAG